jgi:hypothetical protein
MLISTEMVMKIAVVLGESPTSIDPAYFKRFDMNRSEMIGFLALELMKLKPSERNKIMQETRRMNKRGNKRQSRIVT